MQTVSLQSALISKGATAVKASKKKPFSPIKRNNYEQAIAAAKGFLRGTGFNTEKYLRQKQEDIEIEESKQSLPYKLI